MKATKLYLRSPSTIYIDEIRYYWYIPNFLGSHQQQRRHERGSSADHWETLYTCGSHWCTLGSGRQWRFWEKKGTINGFFFEIYGILHGIVNGILWDITWDIYIYTYIHIIIMRYCNQQRDLGMDWKIWHAIFWRSIQRTRYTYTDFVSRPTGTP